MRRNMKMSKTRTRISKALACTLALFLSAFTLIPMVYAAPEDEEEIEVVEIDLDEDEDENDEEENVDVFGEGDYKETTDEDGTTETVTTTIETEEFDTGRNHGAFTVDGNGTIQDVITDGTKEFYVITTANGGIFYLLIDRANGLDNVYLLSAVDEADLLDFAIGSSTDSTTESSKSSTTTSTTTTTSSSGTEVTEEETSTVSPSEDVKVVKETSENVSVFSLSSYSGLIILVLIVVAIIVVVMIFRSRGKKKKQEAPSQGMEYGSSDDDVYDDEEDQ